METATSAELLIGSLNSTSKLLQQQHNNNSIAPANSTPLSNGTNASISPGSAHSSSHSHQGVSPKGSRRVSACSDRSLEAAAADVAGGSPPRAASVSSLNGGASSGEQHQSQLQHDLVAHHMLRNILQGKKELMQLDQELRTAMQQQQQQQQQQQLQEKEQLHTKLNNNNNNNIAATANNNNNTMESINLIDDSEMVDIKIKSEPQTAPPPQQSPHGSSHSSRSGSGTGSHSSLASDGSLRRKSSDSLDSHGAQDEVQDEEDAAANRSESRAPEEPTQLPTKKESVDDMLDEVELLGCTRAAPIWRAWPRPVTRT